VGLLVGVPCEWSFGAVRRRLPRSVVRLLTFLARNSSLYRPQLANGKLRLPKDFEGSYREKKKIASLLGQQIAPRAPDSDAEDDDEGRESSSESSLPEDWMERYHVEAHRPPWMDKESSSSEEERSSDDWSTVSAELSDETRSGRPDEDARPVPVDLGPIDNTDFVDVSGGDGGVLKRLYRAGQAGNRAFDSYVVEMKYVVRDEGGTVVDVSENDMWPNKEHKFTVGAGEVMRGMELIAKNMERKERSRFRVRSDYAFGEGGSLPKVPPGTKWLIIDAEMMGLRRQLRDKLCVRANEALPYISARKGKGNEFYKQGEMRKAVHEYKSCIKVAALVDDPIYKAELATPVLALFGNLAAAHLALKNWKRVVKYTSEVLKHEPANEKAFFRRAQALRQYPERLEEARKDLAEAIRINPKSKQLRDEYATLVEEVKLKRRADKVAYGTIFKEQAAIYEAQRPRVFFEIAHGKKMLGRIEMELFSHKVPRTAENFRALCTGEKTLTYAKTLIHRVVEGYLIQGGDVTMSKGTGGKSIYGATFEDEAFGAGPCDRAGMVYMANSGPHTNQSQFFITLAPSPQFREQYVVVGKVVAGSAVLRKMERVEVDSNDAPVEPVVVYKCGQVKKEKDRMVDSSSDEGE
jgi:cyclophilin family peptidyl-prolyl cis-trans isomerase/FKBP-type peptidyl-prolyl cis-trans isomerase